MNQVWLQVFAVMMGGNIIKYIVPYPPVWVCVDLLMLDIYYRILRRHPHVDVKGSMLFFGGLTVVSILMDLGFIGALIGNVAIMALLGWMIFGQGRNGGSGGSSKFKGPNIRHKWHK